MRRLTSTSPTGNHVTMLNALKRTSIALLAAAMLLPCTSDAFAKRKLQASTENMVRVEMLSIQLEAFSEMNFNVSIHDTGVGGMALSGGRIRIDPWVLTMSDGILAWLMAHEWGHQALGHVQNQYNRTVRRGTYATQIEDEADFYAGAFIAFADYDVDAVARFIRYAAQGSDVHSNGTTRAATTRAGYDEYNRSGSVLLGSNPEGDSTQTRIITMLLSSDFGGLADALVDTGFDPNRYTIGSRLRKGKLNKAVRKYYNRNLVSLFPTKRNKKSQRRDVKAMTNALVQEYRASTSASSSQTQRSTQYSPFTQYRSCGCGNH